MHRKLASTLRISLVALFLSYYAGATLFPHTHTFDWGRVTHSHPYLPSGHHSHTAAGCQAIDHLTHMLFIIGGSSFIIAVFAQLIRRCIPTGQRLTVATSIYYQLRAPPTVY